MEHASAVTFWLLTSIGSEEATFLSFLVTRTSASIEYDEGKGFKGIHHQSLLTVPLIRQGCGAISKAWVQARCGVPPIRTIGCAYLDVDALEFRRNFTPWEVFGVGFSIIGVLPSLA